MQKLNAGGILIASLLTSAEYISFFQTSWTPWCLFYIFCSSGAFIMMPKRNNASKFPEAVCPHCGGNYEVAKFKCSACGKKI
jgi:ribosomal protein L37E